jgi:hypothetical protein
MKKSSSSRRNLAVAVFSVFSLLMNAGHVSRIAERTTPDVLKPVVRRVLSVARSTSERTHLDHVRRAFENLRDQVRGGHGSELSKGEKRVYLLGGDSVMENIAPVFADLMQQQGASVEEYIQRGSEIGDPFVDWGAELEKVVKDRHVDVVVLLVDVKGATLDEAASAAVELVRRLQRAGASDVVWLERPAVRNVQYETGRRFRHEVLMEAQRRVSGLSVLDPGAALVSSQGGYASYIVREDGVRVRVREKDGVHLTTDGAHIVAQAIADQLGV